LLNTKLAADRDEKASRTQRRPHLSLSLSLWGSNPRSLWQVNPPADGEMAGAEHLERMGRELKCPICWSLLRSAVSLVCNHVFCSVCISKSMKSASNCPVCKIPYHRRDIRPSPHMDNLVTIYKTMEVAAGVNIFVTQREPVKKSPDEPVHGEDSKTEVSRDTEGKGKNKSKKKRVLKNKSKDEEIAKTIVSNPSKKRVHVTPYLISETPLKSKAVQKHEDPKIGSQFNRDLINNLGDETRNIATVSKEKVLVDENGEERLCPFFWLREDVDEDEASGRPSTQQLEDFPSQYPPCFSDIKNMDDGNPSSIATPKSKSHAERLFDSELFEWTQRACSPELCLTPIRNQHIRDEDGLEKASDKGQEREPLNGFPGSIEILLSKSAKRQRDDQGNENSNNCQSDNPRKQITRKKKKASLTSQGNTPEKSADVREKNCLDAGSLDGKNQNSETDINYLSEDMAHQNKVSSSRKNTKIGVNPNCQMRRLRHIRKHTNKVHEQGTGEALGQLPSECVEAKSRNPQINEVLPHQEAEKDNSQSASGKWKRNMNARSKERQRKTPLDDANDTCVMTTNTGRRYKTANSGNKVNKNAEKANLHRRRRESKMQRKVADQIDELGTVEDSEETSLPPIVSSGNGNSEQNEKSDAAKSSLKTLETVHASGDHSLRKCSNIPFRTKCAFCQSDMETEVTGNMMHYFNGKPVAADYNGGNHVVHSHKHCAEWAPNVYFEDDSAVNLATELARSKRIKCSCCGLKGAALGCFEKSCRKSFHYTCAKLIQQCRWDTENFVMLCPLHLSSVLPSEIPESLLRRTQSTQKRECRHQVATKPQTGAKQLWKWRSGSPLKCVLCCSALSAAEKEIISEFAKVTGASISKDWSPAVTHVIASTDENGACKRTLKFLMAIAEGKWILRIDWIKACTKAGAPQNEEQYEIKLDVHGVRDGPRLGRLRVINQEPKIFHGFRFYFSGDFTASYKGCLYDLVIASGGIVLQRKPIAREKEKLDDTSVSPVFVIYSLELNEKCDTSEGPTILNFRKAEAEAIADASGAKMGTNTWILDSVAACKLQSLDKY
ncbi:hypothetical protein Taro_014172, partial [Colocasia esculenta]|nr:hypothetical protein [Colocasia esculenta]